MQDGLKDNPEMSLLLNSMTMLVDIILNHIDEASKELKELVKELSKQLEKQTKQIKKLTEAIANKTLTNKRVSSENINGRKSEKNKGVDSWQKHWCWEDKS